MVYWHGKSAAVTAMVPWVTCCSGCKHSLSEELEKLKTRLCDVLGKAGFKVPSVLPPLFRLRCIAVASIASVAPASISLFPADLQTLSSQVTVREGGNGSNAAANRVMNEKRAERQQRLKETTNRLLVAGESPAAGRGGADSGNGEIQYR